MKNKQNNKIEKQKKNQKNPFRINDSMMNGENEMKKKLFNHPRIIIHC